MTKLKEMRSKNISNSDGYMITRLQLYKVVRFVALEAKKKENELSSPTCTQCIPRRKKVT